MRNILTLLISLLSFVVVSAQTQHSIIIDEASFAPESGLAIDKIGKDTSQRPCARIKMHINRMTSTEIDQLKVVTVGGNVVVMKQYVATEGNGLIIELTAKQPTRFYLHHDKYGDSNEVSLNLEGDKEYRLSAQLNISYPIVIATNVIDAEVYIDGIYQGRSDSGYTLTVNDITPGTHKLRVQSGSSIAEQNIEVSSTAIYFRLDVNVASSRPQYVVFSVTPKNAIVVVDNKNCVPDADGIVQLTLNNGSYNYHISANSYHDESGTFVVSGSKVEKYIELRPAHGWVEVGSSSHLKGASVYIDGNYIGKAPIKSDKLASGTYKVKIIKELYLPYEGEITIKDNETLKFNPSLTENYAIVTITVGDGASIYVNNAYKGMSSWTGNLEAGAYIFEARKEGYRTTTISPNITTQAKNQNITLDAPTPITGYLNLTSTPKMATVYIDGKDVGKTPLMEELLIGTHEISVQMSGYRKSTQRVTIAENKTENLNISLQKGSDNTDNTDNTKKNVIEYLMPNKKMEISDAYSKFGSNVLLHTWDPDTGKGVITFMNDVTTIGDGAFYKCSRLTSVTIPDSVTTIGKNAFRGCHSLTSVTIGDSVTTIGSDAFSHCSSLTSVTIPDCVTTIGDGAFTGCNSLQEFKGKFASEDGRCLIVDGTLNSFAPSGLTEYTIPDRVTTIGVWAFAFCRSLNSLTIPDSVTTIGAWAFAWCSSLTSVTIPDSVMEIENGVFAGCNSLQEYKGKFASEDGRCLIIDGVLNSFAPGGLVEYTIPDSVTAIGYFAFRDCSSLTSVTIPDSVTTIRSYAFDGCSSLASVYCKASTPPSLGAHALSNIASSRKIYVPMQSVEQYKKSNGWEKYASDIVGYNF